MLRLPRLVLLMLIAMLIVAVPAAVAQTSVADQYATAPPVGEDAGDDDAGAPEEEAGVPVSVQGPGQPVTPAAVERLPFTGAEISLVALIGLGLLALGFGGVAVTRRRGSSTAP